MSRRSDKSWDSVGNTEAFSTASKLGPHPYIVYSIFSSKFGDGMAEDEPGVQIESPVRAAQLGALPLIHPEIQIGRAHV